MVFRKNRAGLSSSLLKGGVFMAFPSLLRRSGALLLCACLLPVSALAADYPEKAHAPVDYADMAYTGFDDDALQEAAVQLEGLSAAGRLGTEDPQVRRQVQGLYETILREYDALETQYSLIGLRYDADVTDAWAGAEYADFADRFGYASDQCYAALSLLADSPYSDILDADAGEAMAEALKDFEPMTEELAELYRREEALVQQYEQAMAQGFSVTADGREWTREDLAADDTLSVRDYNAILTRLEQAENAAVGPLFLDLVQLRTQIAQLSGYDSYADYAYEVTYARDYDSRDIRSVYRWAKRDLVPLYDEIWMTAGDAISALSYIPAATGEEIWDAVGPYMDRIDPELGETFRFMRRHHLYDVEASPGKNDMGYTVSLPAYGSAFIFNAPYGDYRDYSTLIHEFGHFNETFHAVGSSLFSSFCIDVGEIHSQGLEVLFTAYADELFGSDARGFTWDTLLNMLDSVLDGCLYDEFQMEVYAHPDMTLEEVNRLFKDLSQDYGYAYGEDEEESYFWVEVPHTFQQPMYYISYATSALSALELWRMSREDWAGAVETYMDLSALSMTLPYRQAVREVGLPDVFRSGVISDLAQDLDDQLAADFGLKTHALRPRQPQMPDGVAWAISGALVAAGVLLLLRKSRRRKRYVVPDQYKDPWE